MNLSRCFAYIFFTIVTFFSLIAKGQNPVLDSIQNLISTTTNDSLLIIHTNNFSWASLNNNPDETIENAEKAIKLIGLYNKNNPEKKEFSFMQLAVAFNNLASGYNVKREAPKAIDNYFKALKIYTYLKEDLRVAQMYNNIGSVYYHIKNLPEALKFLEKSMLLKEKSYWEDTTKMESVKSLAQSYNNVGSIYGAVAKEEKSDEKLQISLEYLYKSLEMKLKLGNAVTIATTYNNIGEAFSLLEKKAEAEANFKIAGEYFESAKDTAGIVLNLASLGLFYNKLNDPYKAILYFNRGQELAEIKNFKDELLNIYRGLADAYISNKNFEKATEYLIKRQALREEVYTENLSLQTQELDTKYQTEQKEKEIELLNKENELNHIELQKNKQLTYLFAIGIFLLSLLSFFIYKSYKNKQKINELLEIKNNEISHQKKEITDSINYAKKIQQAILPPDWLLNELLPENFVYYVPKDIVSGDFYWIDHIKIENEEKILFAAVDCTGHGVPGALMSVIGLNLLNQAVHEKKLWKPSEILSYLDWGVNQTLRQSEAGNVVKDGMDLALVCIDFKKQEVQYSGAYNSLYYTHKGELHEIKADKSPIGINTDGIIDEYTNHIIQLDKGDCIYLFSDGYADQFGGPQGKKFKYKQLKELFLKCHSLPMNEQYSIIHKTFESWKGAIDQVDDVIVSGIRI